MKKLSPLFGCAALSVLGAAALGAYAQEEAPPNTAGEQATAPAPAARATVLEYSRRGADSCIACHDEPQILAIFKTPHGRRADTRAPFGHGNLQCEACHGPGGAHAGRVRSGQERPPIPHFGDESKSSPAEQSGMCLGCHQRDMKHGWQGSTHERQGLSCASCHQSHAASDPVTNDAGQPQVCYSCHQQQKAQNQLPFAHPVRHGQMTCSACHDAHGTTADFNLVRRTLNDTCFSCHADKRGPFLWEHAPVAEDCALCHKPHGSNHPGLLTQRAPLLCQQCHSQQGHPSVPLTAARLPGASPSALFLGQGCLNCHSQVHGSNHPSGAKLMR
jgi:DmsE family decaheme c-type cytochrome